MAGPVAHPGVDLGRRRQPGAGQVCLGQASFAVVGTDVAVDVERPGGTGGGVEVSFCQRPQQFCRTTLSCQFFHATPQRGDLGRPVEADEAPYVSGAKAAAQPLGAYFAGKVAEHHGERERAQRVKSGTGGTVDLGERVEQPGRHERRQDYQGTGKRQRRTLGDDGLGTEQHTRPGQGTFVVTGQGRGERDELPRGAGGLVLALVAAPGERWKGRARAPLATARSPLPEPYSGRARSATSSVSLFGPFGPLFWALAPRCPHLRQRWRHSVRVPKSTP